MSTDNTKTGGLRGLYQKEDWWAVWIGLGTVIIALVMWTFGQSLSPITVSFKGYENFSDLPGILPGLFPGVLFLFLVMLIVFSIAAGVMGRSVLKFVAGFTLLFVLAIIVQILGAWSWAKTLNIEAPVMALIIGLVIGNLLKIPAWFDAAMRTEFYVKTGIVFMGATLPFTLILQAGPITLLQASAVAVVTFLVIYWVGTRILKIEKPFAATLGAGGSICGVSASIAIGSSVNAKKSHVSTSISIVVIWATVMVFLLPIFARAIGLSDGAAGALIGTSEFADAAGVAAAGQFGDGALTTFTLMKVVGRDIFVGIWALILAFISVTIWERHKANKSDGSVQKPSASVIWERFPKFVIGFFIASILISLVVLLAPDSSTLDKVVLAPIKNLRNWAFVLCFLCIGLTTRFRDLAEFGWKPFAAFSAGVVVNVGLGILFSVFLLNGYWTQIGLS
ncbi:MAG: YeiH family protein [Coriobacteriales bacterium]|jgi:uncharacterized integral membrane protein (TIGR00698 family)|nr:YeiH family protein [Coriobacteriales bacterium]